MQATSAFLPAFGDKPVDAVTPAALEDFRSLLTRPSADGGKGLKVKTARCIIDGTFRALYRDGRETDHLVTTDPFAALRWPRLVKPEPDSFDEAERDKLLDYFRDKDRQYYALVYLQFWTGMRTGELVGLRRGDLDLRKGELTIRRSRTMGEDNPPKTKRSQRTLRLLPGIVAVLRAMPAPLHATDETFLFTTPTGRPIDEERFVEKH